jgi:hypothetical protein
MLRAEVAQDRRFFEAILCSAPRRQLKRNTFGAAINHLCAHTADSTLIGSVLMLTRLADIHLVQ